MKRMMHVLGSFLSIVLLLFAAGCGGGGSDSSSTSVGTTVTAVDPYLVGAIFQEVDADGNVRQVSAPSDADGQAVFSNKVLAGSTVEMISSGLHNGVIYQGALKLKVEASGTSFVVSPLTTLTFELGDNLEEVVSILQDAGLDITADDIGGDPMAALAGKTVDNLTADDLTQLIANLAVHAALELVGVNAPVVTAAPSGVEPLQVSDALRAAITEMVELLRVDELDAAGTSAPNGIPDILDALAGVVGVDVDDVIGSLAAIADLLITNPSAELPPFGDLLETAVAGDGIVFIDPDNGTMSNPLTTVRANLDVAYGILDEKVGSMTDLLEALKYFKAAKALIGVDTTATQQDKDEAHFFGGFAELLVLADPYSDYVDDGYNTLGDLLDAFGFSTDPLVRDNLEGLLSDQIPPPDANTPTSGELQQAMATALLGRLQVVATDMAAVSSSFTLTRTEVGLNVTSATEYDYGDALFFKGIALAMRAQLNLMLAYDLDVDFFDIYQNEPADIETFLSMYPDLGTLAADYATTLAAAKADFGKAADSLLAAINAIAAESDSQVDDVLSFYSDDPAVMAADIAEAKDVLSKFKSSLSAPITFDAGTDYAVTLNFSKIFTGIDLRDQLPDFDGMVPGLFPDPTLGGIIVNPDQLDINEDLDNDGTPDWLQEDVR